MTREPVSLSKLLFHLRVFLLFLMSRNIGTDSVVGSKRRTYVSAWGAHIRDESGLYYTDVLH